MDEIQMEFFKKRLTDQRKNIEGTINSMKEHGIGEQQKDDPDELSNYDNHPADLGTDLFHSQLNNALIVHEEYLLREVYDALGRIYDGTFGKCEFCGQDIEKERLEAVPYARLCIDCETSKELSMANLNSQRPVEELIWDAPFGRKYLNKREDDEFEGLDQLFDVVKYGSSDTPQDMGGYYDYEEYYTNEIDRQGIVDDLDNISNEVYRNQLPD